MLRGLPDPSRLAGRLIAVEGLDGSGKSTQLQLLARWLVGRGYPVQVTGWNSAPVVRPATRRGKKRRSLTPLTFSLIHATDLADRWERVILPHLRAGYLVLADRWVYTALVRDKVRGMDPEWVRRLYCFAPRPHLTLYFQAPLEVSLARALGRNPALKFYEAGLDLGLHADPVECFRRFQGLMKDEYDRLARGEGLWTPGDQLMVVDATAPISEQQARVRSLVRPILPPPLSGLSYHSPGAMEAQLLDGKPTRPFHRL